MNFLSSVPVSTLRDSRGLLGVSEIADFGAFPVKRIYYITDVPSEISRGAHGHKKLEQIFFCLSGSFELSVTDSRLTDRVTLLCGDRGFFVPKGLWRDLTKFSRDCVCLVLASESYDPDDYIYSFAEFSEWKRNNEN